MHQRIVADLKLFPILLWAAGLLTVAFCVMVKDLTGAGLSKSMFFPLLGLTIYPVFYGSVIYGFVMLIRLSLKRHGYITVDERTITFGGKHFDLDGLSSRVVPRLFGLHDLILERRGERLASQRSYLLSVPSNEISEAIQDWVVRHPST